MNKIDMKKVVKNRIANQKAVISGKRNDTIAKLARQFYKEHSPEKAEHYMNQALINLDKWQTHFSKEFGPSNRMYLMNNAISNINVSNDYAYGLIRTVLNTAANGNDPTTTHEHSWLKDSPFQDELLKLCEEVKQEFYQKPKDLGKLEVEMLSVITSAKSAKVAAEQLEELGITLDVPEAKKVVSTLPAVVKLSVDATLFNKDVAKS